MAWYPGQEGGYALANLLFGDANFSGRLPITFPADGDKLPAFDDYSMRERTYKYMTDNIFYPFGYGLSYGHVDYSGLRVNADKKGMTVNVTLTNPSDRDIVETPQLYLSAPGAGATATLQQLVAFQRVTLRAGESKEVTFSVLPERMQTVQADGSSRLLRGEYTVTVAAAAPSQRTSELGVPCLTSRFKL
jgi:beta-glucosidase